jgi:hypothetical protein
MIRGVARLQGAANGACSNKMLVRRKLAERLILGALTQPLSRAEDIRHVIERVEAEVAKLSEPVPETICGTAARGRSGRRFAFFPKVGGGGSDRRSARATPGD